MRRVWAVLAFATACGEDPLLFEEAREGLSASARRARAEMIRDVAFMNGITNPALLGGIGETETGLAHCWSEATWACQGPASTSCGGGPVIAGAGDGPCELREGGLGLFQFDGGTFDETLVRDGVEILTIEGNVAHVIPFVTNMVIRSEFITGVQTEVQAIDFINQVPIQPGEASYEAWISTVTRYYNGCRPTSSCWMTRRGNYERNTREINEEMGDELWRRYTTPVPACLPVPREGRTIDDDDDCYVDGGAPASWRTEMAGHGGRLRWTYAADAASDDNFAEWNLEISSAGKYRVEVFTPRSEFFQSRQARYIVSRGMARDEVLVDQTAADGFQVIGEYDFALGAAKVRLGDDTGEPYAQRVKIGFDALRLVRVEPAPVAERDPPSMEPAPPSAPIAMTPVVQPPVTKISGEGCQSVPSSGYLPIALVLLATGLRTRAHDRRARTRCPCSSSDTPDRR